MSEEHIEVTDPQLLGVGWTVAEKEYALNRIQYLEKTIEALLKKIGV